MSSGLGKSFQRSQRASERQSRRRYHDLLDAERAAAVEAETVQQQQQHSGVRPSQLQSIWQTNNLEDFLSIADHREQGYFAERDVRVVIDGRPHVVTREHRLLARYDEDDYAMCGNHYYNEDVAHTQRPNRTDGDETAQDGVIRPTQPTPHEHWLRLSESLTIPRRPPWDYGMSAKAVQAAEAAAFVQWRRSLSTVEQTHRVLLTPYEKNLEVWRQLWRVVERADVVMCIVDARDPMLFRSADFERYVAATRDARGLPKRLFLLLNKADLLTDDQRLSWARYLHSRGDRFYFFSAKPVKAAGVQDSVCGVPRSVGCADTSSRRGGNGGMHQDEDDSDDTVAEDPIVGDGVDDRDDHKDKDHVCVTEARAKTRHRTRALRAPVAVKNAYELMQRRQRDRQAPSLSAPPAVHPARANGPADTAAHESSLLTLSHPSVSPCATAQQRCDGASLDDVCTAVLSPRELLHRLALLRVSDENCSQPSAPRPHEAALHGAAQTPSHVPFGVSSSSSSSFLCRTAPWQPQPAQGQTLDEPLMVGLVGYPNVGKSSTINAILGAKKVTVSATPGKTKHFQTLPIPGEPRVMLCDCPGLVFPSFVTTQARMVCAGMLSIDTATDMRRAITLLGRRIPRTLLERRLNLSLPRRGGGQDGTAHDTDTDDEPPRTTTTTTQTRDWDTERRRVAHRRSAACARNGCSSLSAAAAAVKEDDDEKVQDGELLDHHDSHCPAEVLLNALARRRGYMTKHDRPNQSRAAKELLKMLVDGELVYVEPAPGYDAEVTEPTSRPAMAMGDGAESAPNRRREGGVDEPVGFRTAAGASAGRAAHETRADMSHSHTHTHDDDDDKDTQRNGADTEAMEETETETETEEEEEWDTEEEEEAWADLDSADAARALSDADEAECPALHSRRHRHRRRRLVGLLPPHEAMQPQPQPQPRASKLVRRPQKREGLRWNSNGLTGPDSTAAALHAAQKQVQFFIRPRHMRNRLTREESFNAQGNMERLRQLWDAAARHARRPRRRNGRYLFADGHAAAAGGAGSDVADDPYTFINEEGEVELRIDDDDGVVELVRQPCASNGGVPDCVGAGAGNRRDGVLQEKLLSKRQQRREMKRGGGGGARMAVGGAVIPGIRVMGIHGYS